MGVTEAGIAGAENDDIEITLVRKNEQSVGAWAGGTTTQLAIWPPEADYKRRDFKWRVSTARVDLEESVFTSLPGYHRLLMILEGAVRLTHEVQGRRRDKALSAFEQDAFEGDWNTTSRGRCVDFNLMTASCCLGSVEALRSSEKKSAVDLFAPALDWDNGVTHVTEAFYCLEPGVTARLERTREPFEVELGRSDFVMFGARRESFPPESPRVFFDLPCEVRVWGIRTKIIRRAADDNSPH